MYTLALCEPFDVFKHFEDISRIPRGSGNEAAVADFVCQFANSLDLSYTKDEENNIVIRKPGCFGMENAPVVILQGHLDMVCEKNKGTLHDFDKDPLKLVIDGDFVRADGTTLGADNGIAVAFCMAVLESKNFAHPPIEVVLTTNEEVGLTGAAFLSPEHIVGKRFINLDSEEEGVFCASCAGGLKADMHLPVEKLMFPSGYAAYKISIGGLKGGHSGMDINKERGNANRLIGRVLVSLVKKLNIFLSSISGGIKDNAIPRESEAVVAVRHEQTEEFFREIAEWNTVFEKEFRESDSDVHISAILQNGLPEHIYSEQTTQKVISAILLTPNGVQAMSKDIEGLVETSNNLGVVRDDDKELVFISALRSSVITRKHSVLAQIEQLAHMLGAKVITHGDYPAWEYDPDSVLRQRFSRLYKDLYGEEPKIEAIHAGLECGLFAKKVENMDMISMGPNMFDVHTPSERLSISSVLRTWEFLKRVLGTLN